MASRVRSMPPIKVDEYRWRSSPKDAALRVRRACAAEAMFGIEASNRRGENDLFIAATVRLHTLPASPKTLTLGDLEHMTQSSLVQLRASQPQVAVSLSWDKQGKCMLQYRAPADMDEARRWAAGVVSAEASSRTLMDMRDRVEDEKKQFSGAKPKSHAVMVYISASVSGLDAALGDSEVHYLFRFNHCLFDGIASRQIVAMLFQNLASQICSVPTDTNEDIDWKQSISNLPPAFVALMDSEQDLSGSTFDRTVHDHMALMKKKSNIGLKPRQSKLGTPQTDFHTFTKDESQSILSGIATRLQPGHTITHLAMAAVLLALMKADGTPNGAIVSTISVINGRRYLKEYKKGEKLYIASCQAPAILLFENIDQLAISDTSSKSEIYEKLEKATQLARDSFTSNLATPCKLSMSVPVMEFGAVLAAMNTKPTPVPQVESPVFTSDGINERWVPRELLSESNEKAIDVDDIYFFSNQSSSTVSVRLSSWRDCIRLSIDYNGGYYEKQDMVTYLNEIAQIMSTFAN
ncbi:Trichothecene 15-O-acetyltransferase TRI3 [Cladobotryum mycophilum]|uniref:Trichothecene 15-O-acetyltransferase TRI3 n=1 Tax=Cladobotryum mycophilum TaxID=491253 RepID=A0ABR0S5T5_9HYPO